MSSSLNNKIAIVTGASRGIGAQIAYELASRGAKVAITYSSEASAKSADELKARISALDNNKPTSSTSFASAGGEGVLAVQADLRRVDAPQELVTATLAAFGGQTIDILVNNAGCELVKPLGDLTAEDFSYVYDLHVRAVVLLTQAVVPHLPERGGRIINISSVGARAGFKDLSLYCSSKAALEGLTRCFAAELGGKGGHTVNAVNPGPVQTAILEKIPPEIVEMQKKTTPVDNRMGTTDDIAQIVGFLAEEGSRWVTGQTISASGGFAMY